MITFRAALSVWYSQVAICSLIFHLDFTATREQWYYRHYVVCPRHHLYLLIWLSPVIVNQSHTPQIYVRKSLEMRNKVRNHSVATTTNNIKVELFEYLNWIEFKSH